MIPYWYNKVIIPFWNPWIGYDIRDPPTIEWIDLLEAMEPVGIEIWEKVHGTSKICSAFEYIKVEGQ